MNEKRIKLAVLLQDLEFGGTQRYAINLLKHLDRDVFDPELWVLRGGDQMLPMAQATGTPVVRFSESMFVGPGALSGLLVKLLRSRPDVLYTLTVVPNIWGRIFGRLARVPAIVTTLRNRVAKQQDRWLWPLSTRIVVNANSLKELILSQTRISPDKVDVVPNGVDIDHFAPDHTQWLEEPTVIFAGRLVEQKDPRNLLEAFQLVVDKMAAARLIMVGDGHLRPSVERFVRDQSLESHVKVLEGTRDIRTFLRQGWALALPSRFEGSPNVIMEAMASGIPVISTRVDGVPDLIKESETGVMVEPGNPGQLAAAIIGMLSDESRCRLMGTRARAFVEENYSMKNMVRLTEQSLIKGYRESQRIRGGRD